MANMNHITEKKNSNIQGNINLKYYLSDFDSDRLLLPNRLLSITSPQKTEKTPSDLQLSIFLDWCLLQSHIHVLP